MSSPHHIQLKLQFADYKQRLVSVKQSLKYTSVMLTSANRGWIVQMQQQRLFSDRFHESYPTTHDDVSAIAKQFSAGSQKLYDKFTRENNEDLETFHKIQHQVLLYIKEIETLEKMYPKLASAKSEAARYQAKLDTMERGRRQIDPSKKDRNLQKMDRYKEQYKTLLQSVIDNQKKTYAKHPVVFKAALTSYWLNHEKHVNMLVESLEATQQFARKHEDQMKKLDITNYEPDITTLIPTATNGIKNLSSKVSSSDSETSADNIASPSDVVAATDNNIKSSMPPISPVSQPSPSNAVHSPTIAQTSITGTTTTDSKDTTACKTVSAAIDNVSNEGDIVKAAETNVA